MCRPPGPLALKTVRWNTKIRKDVPDKI